MLNTEIYDRYANLLILENYKSACVHMNDKRMLSTVDEFLNLVKFMESKGLELCACNATKGLHFKHTPYRQDSFNIVTSHW